MGIEAAAKAKNLLWKRPEVLRLLTIALFAEIGYAALNISTMPVYLKYDRSISEGWIGIVITAFLLSEAVFKGWMGKIADRVGTHRLMVMGPCITVGTALLSLLIPHRGGTPDEVFAFVVLRVLDGLGAAMLWPAAFAEMSHTVDDAENQQAMSMLNTVYLLGVALALPISGVVNDLSGTRWASLVFAAALFVFVAIAAYRLKPATVTAHTSHEHHEGELDVKQLVGSAATIPTYLLLAVVTFAGVGFPMAVIKLFAVDEFQMSESAFGLLVLPAAIAMAALGVPMSKLGERLGKHRAVHFGMGLCTIGVSLIALGAFIPAFRTVWMLALGGLPLGIGFLLAIPAWMASVSDLDPKARAANVGAVMTAQGIGAIIGAPLGSWAYQAFQPIGIQLGLGASFGHYSPFLGCALCVGTGWVIGLRILR